MAKQGANRAESLLERSEDEEGECAVRWALAELTCVLEVTSKKLDWEEPATLLRLKASARNADDSSSPAFTTHLSSSAAAFARPSSSF
ncbi:hypothetical protein EGR_00555 [Echinococcus granulosus]|uniref:Uncharacterized protein n=1 Tax=Echinococcus granulosus TaxID=6210 RepID=W6USJ3_ECHGR|nr:hypothetical protein EGR_00555 [Echinococcus granulosus]EUB64605.1 hypothetical protein EGR_00555 [Echinococcus granulosus]